MKILILPKFYFTTIAKLYSEYMLIQGRLDYLMYRAVLNSNSYIIYGLYKNNKIVGFVTTYEDSNTILITHTYIIYKYRRYLKNFEGLLAQRVKSLDKILSVVNNDNKAFKLYKKLGYKEI